MALTIFYYPILSLFEKELNKQQAYWAIIDRAKLLMGGFVHKYVNVANNQAKL